MDWIINQLTTLDIWVGWVVSYCIASGVQGLAQFFSIIILTVQRDDKKDPVPHPFEFVDLLSAPLFLFAGWGWAKPYRLPLERFKKKRLYSFLFYIAGPIGNLALAGIISTLYTTLLPSSVFKLAITINVYTGVANLLIPLPPFNLGRGLWMIKFDKFNKGFEWFVMSSITLYMMWAFLEKDSHFVFSFVNKLGDVIVRFLTT